jgi:hypothetical protein
MRVARALSIRANAAFCLRKRIPEMVTGFCLSLYYRVRGLTAVTVSYHDNRGVAVTCPFSPKHAISLVLF